MLEDFELDRRLAPRRRGLGVSFQSLGIFESCSLETDERTLLWSPVQRCTPPVMAWKQRHRRKYLLPAPRAGRVGRAGRHGISSRTTRPRIRRRRQVAAVDATARGAPLTAVAGHDRPAGASAARLHASLPACCPPRSAAGPRKRKAGAWWGRLTPAHVPRTARSASSRFFPLPPRQRRSPPAAGDPKRPPRTLPPEEKAPARARCAGRSGARPADPLRPYVGVHVSDTNRHAPTRPRRAMPCHARPALIMNLATKTRRA